jgi:hypothetical protein
MTPTDINLIFWAAFFFMGSYAGRHIAEQVKTIDRLTKELQEERGQSADTLAFLERFACQGEDCKSGKCESVGDPRSLYCQHRAAANKLRLAIAGERHDPLVETLR